jgi:hypothetical protein
MAISGYSQTPRLLQGALIYFGAPMLIPVPNIIVFQYNPESMQRTLNPWQPLTAVRPEWETNEETGKATMTNKEAYKEYLSKVAGLAQPYDPQETFSLVLELDATDALETPDRHPVAVLAGVADRLAAIEMLMYPPGDSLLGGGLTAVASATVSVSANGVTGSSTFGGGFTGIQRKDVPIVLFFWGPGRIVPVRITALSIEEQQYSPTLYPLRAKATIGIRVLDLDDLVTMEGDLARGAAVEIAKGCYMFTRAQKELLATANLLNTAESVIGMLPI